MMIAYYGRTRLKLSIAVLLLIPTAALFSRLGTLMTAFCSLTLHELAHTVMAHRLGYAVDGIEIMPFGFIARLDPAPRSPSDAAAIAAAGPAVSLGASLLSAGFIVLFRGFGGADALREFAFFNLSLGAFNLLPALPLDGGRLALALSTRGASARSRRRSARVFTLLGTVFGTTVAAFGALVIWRERRSAAALFHGASFLITGAFIAFEAFAFNKKSGEASLKSPSRLAPAHAVRVLPVALDSRSSVRDALVALAGNAYGIACVLDEKKRVIGILDEGALYERAAEGRENITLYEAVRFGAFICAKPRIQASQAPRIR